MEKSGEKIGVTRQTTPCTYQLIALSKALNVSIDTLVENDIQNLLEEKFSLDIPVFVISQKDLKDLLNSALHWWDADERKEHFNVS